MNILNPKIFYLKNNNKFHMKPEIRQRLLEIARTFQQYLAQDGLQIDVVDVRVVGSNAGFDYNEFSDLDLHLVANLDCMECNAAILQVALNAEKTKFNSNLDIKVKGIPVELYVEDVRAGVNSNGIFSLVKDGWIKYPQPEDAIEEKTMKLVADKVSQWITIITKALIRKNENELQRIINRLYLMRKDGLDSLGPNSPGNLIFKEIRKHGYLEQVKLARDEAISERLTLECRIAQEALKRS